MQTNFNIKRKENITRFIYFAFEGLQAAVDASAEAAQLALKKTDAAKLGARQGIDDVFTAEKQNRPSGVMGTLTAAAETAEIAGKAVADANSAAKLEASQLVDDLYAKRLKQLDGGGKA